MLLKLAYSGMKGRKKESFLLGFVIFLSVVFIVTSTVLHTSNQAAKEKERMASFGPWENGYFQVHKDEAAKLLSRDDYTQVAQSQFIGSDPDIGLIASYNAPYQRLTKLQMVEGAMPQNSHEIAIEHSVLASYPTEIKVGDQIQVPITLDLYNVSQVAILEDQITRLYEEFSLTADMLVEDSKVMDSDQLHKKYGGVLAAYALEPDRLMADLATLAAYRDSIDSSGMVTSDHDEEIKGDFIKIYKTLRGDRYMRYILDTKEYDDFTLKLKSYYRYYFLKEVTRVLEAVDSTSEDQIFSDGIKTNTQLIFTCQLEVTGFYESHSNYWDLGDAQVPKAYISQTLYEDIEDIIYDNPLVDITSYMPLDNTSFEESNILFKSTSGPWDFYEANKANPLLRVNAYTYPDKSLASEATITYAILFMIFAATIIAVFQINLSQIKRRSKKLTLLKAVGMVKGQMLGLLSYEFLIFIAIAFPLGILVGLAFVYGLIALLNTLSDFQLIFTIDYRLIVFGLIISLISVVIGMTFPMFKALKTPLTGSMNKPPKRSKHKLKHHKEGYKTKHQSFAMISWSYLVYEKKKNLITLGLYTISITVLIVTLLLAFLSFDRYKDEVLAVDRPDYALESIRAMSTIEMQEIAQVLDFMPEVEDYQFVKYGVDALLHHEAMVDIPVFDSYFENKDKVTLDTHDKATADFINTSMVTNVYGIEAHSYMWDSLVQGMNDFDLKQFQKGEGYLLLLPQYKAEDPSSTSYDPRNNTYASDYPIAVGDTMTLGFKAEPISLVVLSDEKGNVQLDYRPVEILAIGHHTGQGGIWPFSANLEAPVLLTSVENFNHLYPFSKYRSRMDIRRFKTLMETQYPTYYGQSSIYIHTKKGADTANYKIALQRLALENDSSLVALGLESKSIFQENLKLATIILTLGLSIALIILMILFNTAQSKVENERGRVGILQALGVTKHQFKTLYIFTGLAFGLLAIIFAHVVFAGIVLVLAVVSGGPLFKTIADILWLYPSLAHGLISLVFLILAVVTYYLPLKRILRHQPIYNINNNQR